MNINNKEISAVIKTNAKLELPSYSMVTIEYENATVCFSERLCENIALNPSLINTTLFDQIDKSFDLMDRILDEENCDTTGKNLSEKYNLLKKDTDFEIIFSEIYRILTVYRNAKIHDFKSIVINNNEISLIRCDKNIKLIADKNIINLILSYIIFYSNVKHLEINDYYKLNIALWYYKNINLSLKECSIQLMQTKNITCLSRIYPRFICENVYYEILSDTIHLAIKQDYLYSEEKDTNAIDFSIKFFDKIYMFPYEIVKNGTIAIKKLDRFEINGDKSTYFELFYNRLLNNINVQFNNL